ncbi:DNA translocase FtsK [Ancylobacter amanitiformis]|uniref:S-DNA-T family DNA segregation ATPase FtsK/SpoIIIE n=1 Tax=Ancylobacter amanitiformis TaxID=217069 RepID=A0ABU0LMI0_9HYPH|nr:DNA translocase FtsK [Ancylobacter amanitiformis]MDQ0509818.1 S-DNA-T family DNA segregation ATPase FtsK/SpoIIIE [Ancylobacter amanitiformis]
MRAPVRPSDSSEFPSSGKTADRAPVSTHRFSRANPQPLPPPAPKGSKQAPRQAPQPGGASVAAPSGRVVIPSWLQPFSMPPNTRFTRTPDYLLRKAPEEMERQERPAASEAATINATTALVPPRASQTPVLRVPPRKPPLGAGPQQPIIAAELRKARAAQEAARGEKPADTDTPHPAPGAATADIAAPAPSRESTARESTARESTARESTAGTSPAVESAVVAVAVSHGPAFQPAPSPVLTRTVLSPAPLSPTPLSQPTSFQGPPAPAAIAAPAPASVDASLEWMADGVVPATVAVPVARDAAPSSIRQIAGMIQLGWDVPPVLPSQQDETPEWMPDETFVVANDAFAAEETETDADEAEDDLGYDDDGEDPEAFDDFDTADDEAADDEAEAVAQGAVVERAVADDAFTDDAMLAAAEAAMADDTAALLPAGPAAFGGYTVTPAEVSFCWPVFGMVAVPVAEAARAPVAPAVAPAAPAPASPAVAAAPVAPRPTPRLVPSEGMGYELPPLDLLTEPPAHEPDYELSEEFLDRNSVKLQQVLHDFGVRGEIIDANPGPVVTLYELEPAPGIKSSRVIGLSADIARSMSAISARVAVVEGRNVIGIELPNQRRETVWLREMLASHEFEAAKAKLGIGLGKTIGGEPVIVDLARMPHLLVAGTTGSGKSVAINTMILSLLYRHKPEQCRLIMIDPKMLELSVYEGIPHLLTPVVTDPKKAIVALKWAVREMEERYKKMSRLGVRNIDGFNARVAEAAAKGEIITRTVQKGFDRETGLIEEEEEIMDLSALPYIVIVVDEMADLMMVAGKDIEGAIQRLAQMARAAGIHLIMATQRPSVDVITGTIKANFPTRISFQVTSKIDSRTILGEMGAEQLLGQGDMLYMAGGGRISRVHGPFVSDQEVERVVEHLKSQARPEYLDEVTAEEDDEAAPIPDDAAVFDKSAMGEESGDSYDQAVAVVLRDRKASTSYIQRRLQIGYNRAASIMERMENEGIVGPANHAGKREILRDAR